MFSVLLAILVIASVAYFLKWKASRRHMYELAEKIPGENGLPFFGLAFCKYLRMSHNEVLEEVYKRSFLPEFQSIVKVWLGPRLVVGIHNPKDIELVLGSTVHLKKSEEYSFFQPWFGNGLLISDGDTWKSHRKMIAPTFHMNVLKRFMNDFNLNSKRLLGRLEKVEGKEFDCHDYLSETMVETLAETVMGVKQENHGRKCFEYAVSVMKMCDILHLRQTRIWMRPNFLFKWTKLGNENNKHLDIIFNLTSKLLSKKKEDFSLKQSSNPFVKETFEVNEEVVSSTDGISFGKSNAIKDDIDNDTCDIGEKRRLPFLESMLERSQKGDGMSEREINDQVNTLMFEGHDTTAAASSFFLCIMAARPDIQEKCMQEIDSIFGNSDRDVTFQDTLEMKYLERCLMETLRLFPPVPIIARKIEQDIPLVSTDKVIPAGCTLVVGIFKLHRRADIYPNPEHFDPDNFLPEKSASRHYYSFIPFSAGPRSCVGRKYAMLKLKILLANILRNFKVNKGIPMSQWKLQGDIILKRTDGFHVTLESRKHVKAAA